MERSTRSGSSHPACITTPLLRVMTSRFDSNPTVPGVADPYPIYRSVRESGRRVARDAQTTAAANQAADAFFGYFRELVSRRRASPEEDLTTALLRAQRADGEGIFTDEDLLSLIVAIFAAGHGPGIAMIANTWLALLREPSELARLKRHPELIAKAVEEGLLYDPPTQAPNPLVAREDVKLGGKTIHKGEVVSVIIGATNRDPEEFSKPEQFDITRHPNRHLSFSGGPHYCLGAALARTEAQSALGALVKRLDRARLECTVDELRWISHDRFRTTRKPADRLRARLNNAASLSNLGPRA
jgi:cytochrome P450